VSTVLHALTECPRIRCERPSGRESGTAPAYKVSVVRHASDSPLLNRRGDLRNHVEGYKSSLFPLLPRTPI
jgi:hypothetical protein